MICLEVHLNGKKICLAGVGDSGVVSATVSWVGGSPDSARTGGRTESGETRLHVGGLHNPEPHIHIHPRWFDGDIRPGDEVRIRVLEGDTADEPGHEHRQTDEDIRRQQRHYYEQVKARFENEDESPDHEA